MSIGRVKLRVPLALQVSVVAALFVAALVVLWTTGSAVVARERRRSQAKDLLELAGDELAARGRELIAQAGDFPEFPEERSRDELDGRLSATTHQTLATFGGIEIEGGYFVLRFKSFLGTALPELEADLIDIQVDAAIPKKAGAVFRRGAGRRTPGHRGHSHCTAGGQRASGRCELGDDCACSIRCSSMLRCRVTGLPPRWHWRVLPSRSR